MRSSLLRIVVVGLWAGSFAPAASAMFKCTAADGTVLYQARPCGAGEREAAVAGSATKETATRTASPSKDAQERAVLERDLAQRRARCVTYREAIERQKPLFDSPNDVTRQHAANEVKNQERRMRDDGCATI